MKKTVLAVIMAAAALGAAEVPTLWNETFKSGKLNDSLKWRTRGVTVEKVDGVNVISMAKSDAVKIKDMGFNLKNVKVEPGKMYKLTITASVEGPDNLEDMPMLGRLLQISNKAKAGKTLAGWRMLFINNSGKHLATDSRPWCCFVRKGKADYVQIFYTPPQTGEIVLQIKNHGNVSNVLKFYKFSLEEIDGDVRNVNPDFSLGVNNCSGYSYGGAKWKLIEENGKVVMQCNGSWVMGDPIPVKPGEKYILTATGAKSENDTGAVSIWNLSGKNSISGKRSKSILVFRKDSYETLSMEFIVPENVTRIRTYLSRGKFSEVKLIRAK